VLVILILEVLGLIAFGLIIAPLLFYSIGIGFAVLSISATILIRLTRAKRPKAFGKVFKKFLWSTARVVPQGNEAKRKICPPDRFHGSGVYREDGRYSPPVCDLKRQHYPEGRTNKYRLGTPNQQVANRLKKPRNALHSVLLFYRSYYGRSTTVEEK